MLFFKQAFNFKLIEKKNNFKRLLRIPHSESIFCRKNGVKNECYTCLLQNSI